MLLMIPSALIIGILAGMREGSRTDRTLSTISITTTATPEYVSGVIFIAVFSSTAFGLKWFKGTATKAMEDANFENFFLPVLTIALYGMGYIARMTRASMAEVMTAQYIRTAPNDPMLYFKQRNMGTDPTLCLFLGLLIRPMISKESEKNNP